MNRLLFRLTGVAVFVAGLVTGLLLPGEAQATTYQYEVTSQPGTSQSIPTPGGRLLTATRIT